MTRAKILALLLMFQIVVLLIPTEQIGIYIPTITEERPHEMMNQESFTHADEHSALQDSSNAMKISAERAGKRVEDFNQIQWNSIDCRRPSGHTLWEIGSSHNEFHSPVGWSSQDNQTDPEEPITVVGEYVPMTIAEDSILAAYEHDDNHGQEHDGVFCDDTGFYPYTITNSYAAPEMSPAKDAHWFIKKSYSVLAFELVNPSWADIHLYLDVERDQDIYSRYLSFYLDGSLTHQYVIGSGGFHGAVVFSYASPGHHKVEIAINYCGWKDHQWKITYIQPFNPVLFANPVPIYDFWEYFPHGSYPTLEWKVQAGFDTYIHFDTDVMSGSSYDIKLYINDQYRATIDAGGAHALILGAYADDEPMNVKMKIMSASNTYYGTKIDYMTVSHRVVTLEIDYMVDQNQNSLVPIDDIFSMASYVRSYYIMHGYARCDYLVDDEIPWDEGTTWPSEFQQTFETYCDHKTGDYEWVFVANRGTGDYSNAWGFWDPNKPNPPS
ncbi:MAG: hypothetical protein ACOC3C_05925 [Candidatus Thorarchaeota archaeon]